MKLRLEKGSIKVRLSSDEIKALNSDKQISELIYVSKNSQISYNVEITEIQESCSVEFVNNVFKISVPLLKANKWFNTNQVGIKEVIKTENGETIALCVEEDLPPRKNRLKN